LENKENMWKYPCAFSLTFWQFNVEKNVTGDDFIAMAAEHKMH